MGQKSKEEQILVCGKITKSVQCEIFIIYCININIVGNNRTVVAQQRYSSLPHTHHLKQNRNGSEAVLTASVVQRLAELEHIHVAFVRPDL
eukprot:COSAG05_NODE_1736_length_4168_cov_3.129762_5_plen_91_part_00